MNTLKIVFMIDIIDSDLGGTENQLIKMINGLSVKHQILLVCFNDAPWFEKNSSRFKCESRIFKINKYYKPATFLNIIRLIKLLREYRPNIVHTFFPVGNSLGIIVARLAGIKNTISSRRDYGEWMTRSYLTATRFANMLARRIITNSRSVRDLTIEKEKVSHEKVVVIYNGIDTSLFTNITRDYILKQKLKIPKSDKVVGIVANFRPMKHHHTFIKAASEILKQRKDVSFVLVGTGVCQKDLVALGTSLNIMDKLVFTGPQDDILPYLSIIDVGINCSEREGLSNAVMEYMASGIPCVVTDAAGNTDLIAHNVNGYLFKLNDYRALAGHVLKLFDDEITRKKFIIKSREKIENDMSIESMLSNYETIYKKLTLANRLNDA